MWVTIWLKGLNDSIGEKVLDSEFSELYTSGGKYIVRFHAYSGKPKWQEEFTIEDHHIEITEG